MSRTVVLLAYPDCQLLDISGPWQVFASANDVSGRPLYRLHLAADAPGSVATNGGLPLQADIAWRELSAVGPVDTLLVAGGRGVLAQQQHTGLLDALGEQSRRVRRLGSICTGAFLLAAAGLLEGRQATTHWRHCAQLASEYPTIQVVPDALYVESAGRFTSAGVTAGIDLALSLLEADHGSDLAGRVARELVLFLRRPGGQSQFSEVLASQHRTRGSLRRLLDRIHADPAAPYRLETLAESIGVTPRHLSRLFRQQLATTPGAYLTRLRLEQARQALVASEQAPPLERLARQWRLGGAEQLRRLFQRHYGVSPTLYYQRFGPGGRALPTFR
ncbi:helix-turn-helix domain-containing protein [Halomonas sp. MCCC 1A17488]|uniref:Helix-turn-helix domain-containing protein n=1 Tax=Billgrantia sulfidoxydans TaxID=2733484 RepID=A0ABX7W3Y7_9GAMM|nr:MULTISPECIES: DJ-1/PfpI family protein [Halomonas]MCE8015864.1 helix-turn-helix domain-containing protein [Halomonas sp. MCCC 1A17488]MCG3239197.1 helix-turn-helix domain-containing protein [Halomonas sp. MCCC 1A17488]QPP50867.1 DJ-1/PfpI family protein [Halomonas sp. SS10-MC5]QTP54392.1 helix-turn-helix domain-containing protein [Halomonas sulfidoxydans]